MSKNLFVTGTGTDVGKTYVTGLIVRKLNENGRNPAYYKAAMSGNPLGDDGILIPGDARHVREISGIRQPLEEMCPYIYETAVSPHLAARAEGGPVEMERVLQGFDEVCSRYDYVTAEGSGGIICPLRFDGKKLMLEDFVKARDLSCLIVADAGLGTINSVVLTVEYMRARGIRVKGIFFNRYEPGNAMHEDNVFMCEYLTGLKVLARIKEGDSDLELSCEELESLYEENGGDDR